MALPMKGEVVRFANTRCRIQIRAGLLLPDLANAEWRFQSQGKKGSPVAILTRVPDGTRGSAKFVPTGEPTLIRLSVSRSQTLDWLDGIDFEVRELVATQDTLTVHVGKSRPISRAALDVAMKAEAGPTPSPEFPFSPLKLPHGDVKFETKVSLMRAEFNPTDEVHIEAAIRFLNGIIDDVDSGLRPSMNGSHFMLTPTKVFGG